jgi:hypothetical protein
MAQEPEMSLRDWMAAFALAGMLARPDTHQPVSATTLASSGATMHPTDEQLAERAYRLADSMLKARDQAPGA